MAKAVFDLRLTRAFMRPIAPALVLSIFTALALDLRLTGLNEQLWFDEVGTANRSIRTPLADLLTNYLRQPAHAELALMIGVISAGASCGLWRSEHLRDRAVSRLNANLRRRVDLQAAFEERGACLYYVLSSGAAFPSYAPSGDEREPLWWRLSAYPLRPAGIIIAVVHRSPPFLRPAWPLLAAWLAARAVAP